jgi:hypothetical protein
MAMRNNGLVVLAVVAATAFAIYFCGSVRVGNDPIFGHLDNLFGTTVFMTTYGKMVSIVKRKPADGQEKKDVWTKSYQDFNKVLKNTSE